MGMRVVGTRRSADHRTENHGAVDVLYPPNELHIMFAECDFIVLAPVLTDQTNHMINKASINSMRDGAIILNVGRGELIDETDLKDALRSGKLGGAYLDVYEDEWSKLPDPELMAFNNVIMTPHNSGHVDAPSSHAMAILKENLARFLDDQPLINEVDTERGY